MTIPQFDEKGAVELAQSLAADFAGRANEADRLGKMPPEDVTTLRRSGYLALNVPREYGGSGLSLRECVAAQMALAQGSGSSALVAGMPLQIFGYAAEDQPWAASIYERFCREAVAGSLFNALATEPEMGSPSRGSFYRSRAEPADGGYLISGHKTWVTGGRYLTHLLVSVSLKDKPAQLLVEAERPGIEWTETWGEGLALRASESHDVTFTEVWVPQANLIIPDRRTTGKNAWFPLVMGATYLGLAIAARNGLIRYALERTPTALGRPIATLPNIRRQIGEIDMWLQAARALLLEVAGAWDGHKYSRIAGAKHFVIEVANDVTDKALRIAGGAGLTRTLPLERYFRDVRAGSMQPPSGDAALEIIGRGAIEEIGSLP